MLPKTGDGQVSKPGSQRNNYLQPITFRSAPVVKQVSASDETE
jgi:hypothetical protein